MKYKKGSTVEVFCNQSWRCARIVSSKGHNYTVSYDVYPGFTSKDDVEHMSVKYIRPCPPLLESSESWVAGDVAEVFHNLLWKMAIVLQDFGWDQYKVRLVRSSQEFEVTKSELRVRQLYQNGQWIVIGKVSSDHKDANRPDVVSYDQDLHERDGKRDFYTSDLHFDTQNNHVLDSRIGSSKTLKRASLCSHSPDETNNKRVRKSKMTEKEGSRAWVPGTSTEKVDTVANMKKYTSRTSGYESSSGSCSINSYKSYGICHGSGFVEDIEEHESDAESVCPFGYHEESESQETDEPPVKEAVADEIHRLELHAYRYTMAALHASGPLNWEKETMVTNLRMSLHISNDEHLVMLKNLLSASGKTLNR